MKILVNNEIELDGWKRLLSVSPYSSPFQTPEYFDFCNLINGYSADVFAVINTNVIEALLVVTVIKQKGIKGNFSRRGIIYGGPICNDSDGLSLGFLLQEVGNYYKKKLIYLEIRNSFDYSSSLPLFLKNNWQYVPHLNVQLSVRGKQFNDILNLMTYNRRREIKMSIKEGAIVYKTDSYEEVNTLYEILEDMYNTRVKLPLPPFEYFASFLNSFLGCVFVVKHNDKVIGGSFCITDHRTSVNTLYYTGLRSYHKKIFPTHMAIIGAIKYAISQDVPMIDFMGAGKPDVKYGVRDFKLQFGGELVEHGRFIKILKPTLYRIGVLGLSVLSKLKK